MTRSRSRWALAALFLVLAGLFGMHGLGDHSAGHSAHVAPAGATDHGTDHRTGHETDVAGAAAPGTGPDTAVLSAPPVDDGMAGLCLAVLLGGLGALLLLGRGLRRTPWLLPRLTLLGVAPPARGRDPDPPLLSALCVCRC
ncbi:DUF6153 family protein [Nocardioides kribbensis]|uniref:DUF6153 family protein n=1 Tax=Nocardioides kribbensis TaxID=305517 RepID=UPI00187A5203|nr:DUF6153 family protein [Nocardioides kribbensis]